MAVVAAAMHPAGQTHHPADVVVAQLAARDVAVWRGKTEGSVGRNGAGITHAAHGIRTRAHPTGNRTTSWGLAHLWAAPASS